MVKKCFFNVVKSGVCEVKFGQCSLVACLGKVHSNLLGVEDGFVLFLFKLGVNDIVVLDMNLHLCDALVNSLLLVNTDFFLLIKPRVELGDVAGHSVEFGFDFLQGLFVGDDSRAEYCNKVCDVMTVHNNAGILVLFSAVDLTKCFEESG
eukprot:4525382-Ditylum_brightwellii.AAC.1